MIVNIYFFGICFSLLLVYVTGRFRPPLVPIMMLFSSCTIFYLANQLKKKNFKTFFSMSAIVIILFSVFNQKVAPKQIRGIDFGNLGVAYDSKENHEMALINYQKAIEADPSRAEGYLYMAASYQKHHQNEKAIEVLKLGITKAKSAENLQSKLAYLYFETGHYHDAERTLRDALADNPENREIINNLGLVLRKIKENNK